MKRDVSATIALSVTEPADLVFAVAVSAGIPVRESLRVTVDDAELDVAEIPDLHGTRLHRVLAPVGGLVLAYSATADPDAAAGAGTPVAGTDTADRIRYIRPSRYAESDVLAATAAAEFGGIERPADLLAAVSSWVGTRLAYLAGASLPTDGAERTLLARRGVCRDFAHLCVALLRARGIPARLVSVYAPGLSPMDFHAVAEAWVDGAWRVVDATALAPRQTLVRIATGRDAADTAFLTVLSGRAEFDGLMVTAVAESLPADDVTRLVSLP
ncbi:transglutaminase-like domain-containing protein [Microbacterium caowuchunii]|uniref:Transglutaminase family protein n=1 Tax=Microbacterium caowuchunii TaxID=2614638 RepID=A0A5N0TKC2_9MICO|nr:transglutaminase family protein [Microbacterium caowuchunii]KAA9135442.1 transglutaminase family protein [Microbacterium caowuchunii]